ncbi:MAG TPA: cation:proton antiporter, partial [Candidatus Woesebacteria bacterium]|nr:cation:proton antiporter [Candidatus Woesebacteria bacterium]
QVALLFGAIIATTDLIGVIALFKSLGGPKRLALVADGESLLSDATGVIIFKLVSTFVIANEVFNSDKLFASVGDFLYVFLGSLVVGTILGYGTAKIVFDKFRNDKLLLTTITIAFAFLVFNAVEHYLHLSGVVTLVIAAIVVGNFGKQKTSIETTHFISEFWEHLGFFCVSLVFFFATFNLDISIFNTAPVWHIAAAIGAALLGRAVSIYVSCWITNTVPFFKNEPNIPLSWQHILNWGGLRGVLPLIFVYSIPQEYEYYPEILVFTFSSILFTLVINGFTVKYLLLWLKLHLPAEEENIIQKEIDIFSLEEARNKLKRLPKNDFTEDVIKEVEQEIYHEEKKQRQVFESLTQQKSELVLKSIKIQVLEIERKIAEELFEKGYINEDAYIHFESELDLQLDAVEYPDVFSPGDIDGKGRIKSRMSFRKVLQNIN